MSSLSKRKVFVVVAIALFVYFAFQKDRDSQIPTLTENMGTLPKSDDRIHVPKAGDSSSSPSASSSQSLSPSPTRVPTAPSLQRVRAQISLDPHVTPLALVDFARELGPVMSFALQQNATVEDVTAVSEQLKVCATSNHVMSVRALCYINMKRIYKVHPRVQMANVEWVEVPERVKELAQAMGQ